MKVEVDGILKSLIGDNVSTSLKLIDFAQENGYTILGLPMYIELYGSIVMLGELNDRYVCFMIDRLGDEDVRMTDVTELLEIDRGFEFVFWPTTSKVLTQGFGVNPGAYDRFGLPGHAGIDIANTTGEPVFAVAPGEVYRNDFSQHGFGNHVRIKHADGFKTIYAHLSRVDVELGDFVDAGDVIGLIGSTGNSTGPHLHIELRGSDPEDGWPYGVVDITDYLHEHLPIPSE